MQGVEILAAVIGDRDHVLEPDATDCGAVQARLHGQDVTRDQLGTLEIQKRWFMDIQSDSVPGSVDHATEIGAAPSGGSPVEYP